VCGFSEMKRAECWSEDAERRCEARGASAAIGIAAGAGPIRFTAVALSTADDATSATSILGPQWGDEIEFAMTEVA
jgi:hypothetical protein